MSLPPNDPMRGHRTASDAARQAADAQRRMQTQTRMAGQQLPGSRSSSDAPGSLGMLGLLLKLGIVAVVVVVAFMILQNW